VGYQASLGLAEEILKGINSCLAVGVVPPSIELQVEIVARAIAEILQPELDVMVNLNTLLASAGLHVYVFDGVTSNMGSEVSSALAGRLPGGGVLTHCNAIILATTAGATWSAVSSIVGDRPIARRIGEERRGVARLVHRSPAEFWASPGSLA
jgi:hypothetical protein